MTSNPDAAPEEFKKAYRAMAFKTHPDRGGVTHLFRMVQEAYETLSDPDKRAAYDRQIGAADTQQPEEEPQAAYEGGDEPSPAYPGEYEPAPARRVMPKAAVIAWLVMTPLSQRFLTRSYPGAGPAVSSSRSKKGR